jgi:hypothetical protein
MTTPIRLYLIDPSGAPTSPRALRLYRTKGGEVQIPEGRVSIRADFW